MIEDYEAQNTPRRVLSHGAFFYSGMFNGKYIQSKPGLYLDIETVALDCHPSMLEAGIQRV